MAHPPLTTGHRVVLLVHLVLVAAFVVLGLVGSSGADGWADLARVALLLLAGAWLLGVVVALLVAARLLRGTAARYAVLVLLPPAALGVVVALVRG